MATLQERRLGYHPQTGLEPGTFGFSALHKNHFSTQGSTGDYIFPVITL
jgi:hypothetical protein